MFTIPVMIATRVAIGVATLCVFGGLLAGAKMGAKNMKTYIKLHGRRRKTKRKTKAA